MALSFRGIGIGALAAFVAACGLVAPAALCAITFTVDSTADIIDANLGDGLCAAVGGGCTLRAAVMQANLAGGVGATIALPAGTYFLVIPVQGSDGDFEGDLNLKTPASGNPVIQIVGAGAATTFIDPDGLSRAFDVATGRTASIAGVTIRNGYLSGGDGGGIRSAGTLSVSNSVVSGNAAFVGGAIESAGALTLTATAVHSNSASFAGGGIYQDGGALTMTDSVISGNASPIGDGGGLLLDSAAVVLDRTTVSGNSSGKWGGGIEAYRGSLVLRNSTISGNHADSHGGGIFVYGSDATVSLYSSSILFNEADADADVNGGLGGGVYNSAATVNVRNSLIAGNYLAGFPDYDDCWGTIGSFGMNLFTSAASVCNIVIGLGGTGYVNSLYAIGPLQANGGPTPTHALLAESNAIDGTLAAYPCVGEASQPLLTDQRGVARALGLRCDVGAFEFDEIFRDGFETGDISRWLDI